MKNFSCSGKKGDFLMSLYVVKAMGGGNVYLTPGEFEEPLESILESCGRLFGSQKYVHTFDIHHGEPIDVDLGQFRKSLSLMRTTLLEVLCRTHGLEFKTPVSPWVDVPPDDRFSGKIVIHRRTSLAPERGNVLFDWKWIIDLLGPDAFVFVSRLESEWKDFSHSNIEYYCPADNYEHARIIKGSRLYIGNQSFPSALADALGVNRIFELSTGVDRRHFAVKYAENAWYFASPWDCTFKNFRYVQAHGNGILRDLVTQQISDHPEPYPFNLWKALFFDLRYRWNYHRVLAKRFLKKALGRI